MLDRAYGEALEALASYRAGTGSPDALAEALDGLLRAVAERNVALAEQYDGARCRHGVPKSERCYACRTGH